MIPPASRRATMAASLAAIAGSAQGEERAPGHIVLLGDSVFDNKSYVPPRGDVTTQLRASLPPGWGCTLAAVDGATTADVAAQLARIPPGATHLVISAGGNDALQAESVLSAHVASVGAGLAALAGVRDRFQAEYARMLDLATPKAPHIAVCTIYDPHFPDPVRQRLGVAGLTLFNDVIMRQAFARFLTTIDLRLICGTPGDLANPIEPSAQGGRKIAAAITAFATGAGPQPAIIART